MTYRFKPGRMLALMLMSASPLAGQISPENITVGGNLHVNYFYDANQPVSNSAQNRVYDMMHNQIFFPMSQISLGYSKEKTRAILDLNFGPAAKLVNLNDPTTFGGQNDIIQNAYLIHGLTDKLSIEAGKFGTHIGYEVIDPTLNMNYSFSYLFYYGPFTHVGARARYAISDKYSVMGGIYNNWDNLADNNSGKTAAASFGFAPGGAVSGSVNWIGGYEGSSSNYRSLLDLVLNVTVSEKLLLGSNTIYGTEGLSWYGEALYLKYTITDKTAAALRLEYLNDSDNARGLGTSVTAATLSGTYALGSVLAVRPELRYERAESRLFENRDGAALARSQLTLGAALVAKF